MEHYNYLNKKEMNQILDIGRLTDKLSTLSIFRLSSKVELCTPFFQFIKLQLHTKTAVCHILQSQRISIKSLCRVCWLCTVAVFERTATEQHRIANFLCNLSSNIWLLFSAVFCFYRWYTLHLLLFLLLSLLFI